jgi:alcohol dehydrogenase class IV
MSFEFATATRIIFGSGTLSQIGTIARDLGTRALIVTGCDTTRAAQLIKLLRKESIASVLCPVTGEPVLDTITQGVALARSEQCDLVIGFGGGSAIDAGKAIAAMITNDGDLLDYLEVIGQGRPLIKPSAPFIAIPTTAGTGAEVTRNAVLGSPAHRVKVSLRSPLMLPRVALVDPMLTLDLPSAISASTGLDALTQLIEAYVSTRANPMTDALCEQGIRMAARSLEKTFTTPGDLAAREDMSLAAMYSGIALANAGLGAVHGFAAPIGGMFPAPHGTVCAALLPHVWEANLAAVIERGTDAQRRRFDRVSHLLTGSEDASAAVAWLQSIRTRLLIPPLRSYGIAEDHLDEIITRARQASSMKANPAVLEDGQLGAILRAAL